MSLELIIKLSIFLFMIKKKQSLACLQGLQANAGGLSDEEVKRQSSIYGPNSILEMVENPWKVIAMDTLKDPMIWFLVFIGTIFILVGHHSDALVLFIGVLPLLFMDFILHWRTQISTSNLKGQLATNAKVIRNNQEIVINSQDVLPGDLVILNPKEYVPADGIIISTKNLQIDESVLTGEAFPIKKNATTIEPIDFSTQDEIMVDADTLAYAGTRVLTGNAILRVLNTGQHTAYGEIIQSIIRVPHARTQLQKSISKLVQVMILVATIFCFMLAGIRIYEGYGWLDALLSAGTLAIAAIPEEFPVVFSFFLGVGIYRLAKQHALVRRAVSVENIGRISFICSDKTGTITHGKLELTHIDPAEHVTEIDILKNALASSDPLGEDPVDQAILEKCKAMQLILPERVHVFPFTEDRKKESAFVIVDGHPFCYLKGSPETVLSLSNLSEMERNTWLDRTLEWAKQGHKVLACAWYELSHEDFSKKNEPEKNFHFAGLLAFEDPPRAEVPKAIQYCLKNGIKVLMITGDHPVTALAIAKEVGLGNGSPNVISAEELPEHFQEEWLSENPNFIKEFDVIARCKPLEKYHIVRSLKNLGELVAVTGDGVNDVPALKAADIGIAMGLRGSKSAKEVSSIILTDDNFNTIVNAIREGRQLLSNLKLSFAYLLLFHIPFVLTAALIPLLGYPLLYFPIHVVWLELYIHPTALFAFQQPTSKNNDNLLGRNNEFISKADIFKTILIGLIFTIVLAFIFISGISESSEVSHGRAKIMSILSLWSTGLVFVLTKGKTFLAKAIMVGTMVTAVLAIQFRAFAYLLHLSPLHYLDWLINAMVVAFFLFLLKLKSK